MRTTLALLLVASACSDTGLSPITRPHLDEPQIRVEPREVDFGEARASQVLQQDLTITNVGSALLQLGGVHWPSETGGFSVLTDLDGNVLGPGDSTTMTVTFQPLDPERSFTDLHILSDDPQYGAVQVDLVGTGRLPRLAIDPTDWDFGDTEIGCEDVRDVRLENTGNETLVVEALDWSGDAALRVLGLPPLPLQLEPGVSTTVSVRHIPGVEGAAAAALTAYSNDPAGSRVSSHRGEGVYGERVIENFTAPVAPPVDILFAIDQSCSMEDDATRLGANFVKFVDQLGTVTRGWRVGVATKDSGCFRDGYYEASTRSYQDKFKSAVLAWDGGAYTEALLSVARNALREATSGCNRGFLRPEANLHVILVSDEPEQSPETWSRLVAQIQALHPTSPDRVKISAVAGDYPSGCATAAPGEGYWQAARDTDGAYLSICDANWARHVGTLATASLEGLARFELAQSPDPTSLTVYVNSVTTDAYHLEGQTLVLDDVPPQGAAIRVEYGAFGCR